MPAVLRDNAINKVLQLEKEIQQYPSYKQLSSQRVIGTYEE